MKGYKVLVEADVRMEKEQCVIIGLPDTSIKESKERILSNLHALAIDVSMKKITIHLSPAERKKIAWKKKASFQNSHEKRVEVDG